MPIFINSLPQLFAKCFALTNETHGSFLLATTIVLKFIFVIGIGTNPFVSMNIVALQDQLEHQAKRLLFSYYVVLPNAKYHDNKDYDLLKLHLPNQNGTLLYLWLMSSHCNQVHPISVEECV